MVTRHAAPLYFLGVISQFCLAAEHEPININADKHRRWGGITIKDPPCCWCSVSATVVKFRCIGFCWLLFWLLYVVSISNHKEIILKFAWGGKMQNGCNTVTIFKFVHTIVSIDQGMPICNVQANMRHGRSGIMSLYIKMMCTLSTHNCLRFTLLVFLKIC